MRNLLIDTKGEILGCIMDVLCGTIHIFRTPVTTSHIFLQRPLFGSQSHTSSPCWQGWPNKMSTYNAQAAGERLFFFSKLMKIIRVVTIITWVVVTIQSNGLNLSGCIQEHTLPISVFMPLAYLFYEIHCEMWLRL